MSPEIILDPPPPVFPDGPPLTFAIASAYALFQIPPRLLATTGNLMQLSQIAAIVEDRAGYFLLGLRRAPGGIAVEIGTPTARIPFYISSDELTAARDPADIVATMARDATEALRLFLVEQQERADEPAPEDATKAVLDGYTLGASH